MTYGCPNCDARFVPSHPAKVYCGLRCYAEADFVRYARRKYAQYADGEVPADIAETITMLRAHALAGGYDRQARVIPDDVRAFVQDRDNGRCVICGEVGIEIDHIDGASSDPANLRLVCHDCHMEITRAHIRPTTDEDTVRRAEALFVRVHAPEPLYPCDADDWSLNWRAWIKENVRHS